MSTTSKPTQTTAIAQDQQAIAGIQKNWSKVKSIQIAGNTQTPAALEATFQADIDATTELQAAVAAVKVKRTARNTARAAAAQTRQEIKQYIIGVEGKNADQMLQDFGLAAPKQGGPKTVEAKAQAVSQMLVTRELRGTKGTKQKAKIKAPPVAQAQVAPTATASGANGTPPASK
jgi:hypothetical protein